MRTWKGVWKMIWGGGEQLQLGQGIRRAEEETMAGDEQVVSSLVPKQLGSLASIAEVGLGCKTIS